MSDEPSHSHIDETGQPNQTNAPRGWHHWFNELGSDWKGLLAILGILWAVYSGIQHWVEATAKSAVSDEKFLAELSKKIRPIYMVDSHEAVIEDIGGSDYIQEVKIQEKPEERGYILVLHCKRFLVAAPVVTCVDGIFYSLSTVRTNHFDWVIDTVPNPNGAMFLGSETRMARRQAFTFKIEILH